MRPAARVLTLFTLMIITAGLLSACAGGPLRRRVQLTAGAEGQSTATDATVTSAETEINRPVVNPTVTAEQVLIETGVPTAPAAAGQPTLSGDTTGQNLEILLDQLSTANAAGDSLEDVE